MKGRVWKRVFVVGLALALMIGLFQVVMATPPPNVAISPLEPGMTDDGVPYDRFDILVREGTWVPDGVGANSLSYSWYKLFDGEDFGLGPKHTIMSMYIEQDEPVGSYCGLACVDYILMSFGQDAIKVPGITPKVAGQDLVVFDVDPISVTVPVTPTGSFYPVFDGSDVGLTTQGEKIEAMDYWPYYYVTGQDIDLPYDCTEGIIFINTLNSYRVPAAEGGSLVGSGSDILAFCATNLGPNTAGFWFRVWDEGDGDKAINPANAINGIDIDEVYWYGAGDQEEDEAGEVYFTFTVRTTFTADFVAGGPGEAFGATPWPGPYFGPIADFNDDEASLNGVAGAYDVLEYLD